MISARIVLPAQRCDFCGEEHKAIVVIARSSGDQYAVCLDCIHRYGTRANRKRTAQALRALAREIAQP